MPLQVGNIYQRFSDVEEGLVENIIQLSVPFLLEPGASLPPHLLFRSPPWGGRCPELVQGGHHRDREPPVLVSYGWGPFECDSTLQGSMVTAARSSGIMTTS